jgi:hypothetical protein
VRRLDAAFDGAARRATVLVENDAGVCFRALPRLGLTTPFFFRVIRVILGQKLGCF